MLWFAPASSTFAASLAGGLSAYCLYKAGRFAFYYPEEMLRPVRGRQEGYQHLFLQAYGHVGVVVLLTLALAVGLIAVTAIWRLSTVLPAAILMPDALWLHPTFGKKPIPYSDVVSVRMEKVGPTIFSDGQLTLIVDTEKAAVRNSVVWAYFSSARRTYIRKLDIDGSPFGMARFRDRLVVRVQQARGHADDA